ncbi:hypothetical protein Tco_1176195 [Tanacetum coccineum]
MVRDLLTVQASTVASESDFSIRGMDHLDAVERLQHISSLEGEIDIEQELHDVEVKAGFAISLSDEKIALDEAASEARSEASKEELTLKEALN